MARDSFGSHAWLLRGLTGSVPGWLQFEQGRLRFASEEEIVFDVERSDISAAVFPWYYFGGGVKLRAAGEPYRLSFVKPNGAEYANARALASAADPAALRLVASKVSDISTGRNVGREWRRLLGEAAADS
jgi:hypothetical protein